MVYRFMLPEFHFITTDHYIGSHLAAKNVREKHLRLSILDIHMYMIQVQKRKVEAALVAALAVIGARF